MIIVLALATKLLTSLGPGAKQLWHAGSLRQNEHACILDGRGLGHCWVIVVCVLGSGATLGLADARGYRCRNKHEFPFLKPINAIIVFGTCCRYKTG